MMSRGKYVGRCSRIENTCGDAWCATYIYATFARMNFMVCECARLQNS